MAKLVHHDNGTETVTILQEGSNTLGREATNMIVIDSAGVSRHHATIRWEPPHCRVVDHSSTNGTFVNNERIEVHGLRTGDVLRTGPIEWSIELEDADGDQVGSVRGVDATVVEVVEQTQAPELRSEMSKRGRPLRSDKDLATLYQTVDCLVANTKSAEILKELVEHLVNSFSASGAAAFEMDRRSGDLELCAGATNPPNLVLPVSKTLVGMAIKRNESLLVSDAAAEGLSAESGSITTLRIHSALAAPLLQHGTQLGALQLSRSPDQRAFNDKDLKLFSVVAEMVGMALLNCRRREELESENITLGEIVKRVCEKPISWPNVGSLG